jgi:ribonucleoside-diphosphate reductase alpha chain
MGEILKVKKRNGSIIPFEKERITKAIFKAAQAAGGTDKEKSEEITNFVLDELKLLNIEIPSVELIQDIVEKILIEKGHAKTAKQFILYRATHQKEREIRNSIIGSNEDMKISLLGALIAKKRYLEIKDNKTETIKEMFERVTSEIIKAEKKYNKENWKEYHEKFLKIMIDMKFIPGGRILANSGKNERFLMNSFVLPIEDKIEGIFETLRKAIIIQKGGGGTGFDFSKIRPRGSKTEQTESSAAGPLSFIIMFNDASRTIKNRGNRMGANMGVLRVDHPQILDFITLKEKFNLEHFNISVAVTDQFMDAVSKNQEYSIIDPYTKKEVEKIKARRVLDLISTIAWKSADPGLLFIDTINENNSTKNQGDICTTDTCAEMPMHENESAPLGSINLTKFINENKEIDYENLKEVIHLSVRFLDNAIDASWYPFKEIEIATKNNRRIGLGVMGWADLLYALRIPYNSNKAVNLAREIMSFINKEASLASQNLAEERGNFLMYKGSIFEEQGIKRRNATVTAIAPTGSISLFANTSSSIEPNFGLSTMRQIFGTQKVIIVNKEFEDALKEEKIYSEQLMKEIADKGNIKDIEEIPEELKNVFVVAHEIEPKWHLRMQAAFQEHVEGSISKTINFPTNTSMQDIYESFTEAYKLGLKGISIYRDGSKENQILQSGY